MVLVSASHTMSIPDLFLATKMTELRTVIVFDKPSTVIVYRTSKDIWIVRADCRGRLIRVEGPSEAAALERWQAAAEGSATTGEAAAVKTTAGAKTRKASRKTRSRGKAGQSKS